LYRLLLRLSADRNDGNLLLITGHLFTFNHYSDCFAALAMMVVLLPFTGYRLPVTAYWLLGTGDWLLRTAYRLHDHLEDGVTVC